MSDLKSIIKSYLSVKDLALVPTLLGPHGIGKTTTIREVAKELNLPLLVMNLSALEPSDFTGRTYIDSNGLTSFAKPSFLDFEGIIFLDEVTGVQDIAVQNCLKSLFFDRSINGHALKGLLIAAGNVGAEYSVSEFDSALSDRIIPLKLDSTIETWIAREKSLNDSPLVAFISASPSLFQSFSFRRLSQANLYYTSAKTAQGLENILNHSVVNLFSESLHSDALSVQDVLSGKKTDLKEQNKIRLTMLCHDLSAKILTGSDLSKKEFQNIKSFLTEVGSESRLAFFSDIKKGSETIPNKDFVGIVSALKDADFFSGDFKEYLKIIFE